MIAFVLSALLLLNPLVHASEVSSVYGKILKSKKSIYGLTSPYFVTFEHEGKLLAYPLDTKSKAMADKIKSFVDQDALIEGDIEKESFKADGLDYVIETFVPRSISPLKLSSLGETEWTTTQRPLSLTSKNKKKESNIILGYKDPNEGKLPPTRGPKQGSLAVGYRLNDSVANALIFTGAAAIIGTQLLKKK
jgi:hypothetical protein